MSEHVYDFTYQRSRHFDPNNEKHVAALQRALKDNLSLRPISTGRWTCRSKSFTDPYEVTLLDCSCPGFRYSGYCKHMALARTIGQVEGLISQCPACDLQLIVYPPMSPDEWSNLHV